MALYKNNPTLRLAALANASIADLVRVAGDIKRVRDALDALRNNENPANDALLEDAVFVGVEAGKGDEYFAAYNSMNDHVQSALAFAKTIDNGGA